MSTRLETKPGASLTATGVLPKFLRELRGEVERGVGGLQRANHFHQSITGTGFMKCMRQIDPDAKSSRQAR